MNKPIAICSSILYAHSSSALAARTFRTKKSFAAVRFERGAKGRIVLLPEGAELEVIGPSALPNCLEVVYECLIYNMFKTDLLGPSCTAIMRSATAPGAKGTASAKAELQHLELAAI